MKTLLLIICGYFLFGTYQNKQLEKVTAERVVQCNVEADRLWAIVLGNEMYNDVKGISILKGRYGSKESIVVNLYKGMNHDKSALLFTGNRWNVIFNEQ